MHSTLAWVQTAQGWVPSHCRRAGEEWIRTDQRPGSGRHDGRDRAARTLDRRWRHESGGIAVMSVVSEGEPSNQGEKRERERRTAGALDPLAFLLAVGPDVIIVALAPAVLVRCAVSGEPGGETLGLGRPASLAALQLGLGRLTRAR